MDFLIFYIGLLFWRLFLLYRRLLQGQVVVNYYRNFGWTSQNSFRFDLNCAIYSVMWMSPCNWTWESPKRFVLKILFRNCGNNYCKADTTKPSRIFLRNIHVFFPRNFVRLMVDYNHHLHLKLVEIKVYFLFKLYSCYFNDWSTFLRLQPCCNQVWRQYFVVLWYCIVKWWWLVVGVSRVVCLSLK